MKNHLGKTKNLMGGGGGIHLPPLLVGLRVLDRENYDLGI